MLLFINYQPLKPSEKSKKSCSQLVVGTPMEGDNMKMLKLNTFEGDKADEVYDILVGAKENNVYGKNKKKENK